MKRSLSLQAYGLFTSLLFRADTPPSIMRSRFERFGYVSREAMLRKHPRLVFGDHRHHGLSIESVCAIEGPACVVIHLHGGAFLFGSAASYRNRAMRLSFRLGAEVFLPDYRLAPEHPFPAALDDALAAYHYVRALRPNVPIFLTGDSAGGGLVLSVLIRLRELGLPQPRGAIMLSPWTDLLCLRAVGR
ncbi:MAG: alpha/beta hydrolase fold domain-containing protein [Myxococcales bacterium]